MEIRAEDNKIVFHKHLKMTKPCKEWLDQQENGNGAIRNLILSDLEKEKDVVSKAVNVVR
ncbi:unnamed protein product [marine sediment metagenome]|uniref:Uncharacterized protein n=1 Tax=marine sediment metagenome TaxID=412755 RepID=X1C305_9ZZZZ